jgi:hypothetical protein
MTTPNERIPERSRHVTRREFIRLASVGAVGGAVIATAAIRVATAAAPGSTDPARWSDPATWGGLVPGPGHVAIVSGQVLVDADTEVAGVHVNPGGSLLFPSKASRTIRSRGNVVVRGNLVMKPSRPGVVHRLVFVGVKEAHFKGGGMDPLKSDVGLWVMGRGRLKAAGSPKLPWTRATGALRAGARTIHLRANPAGWRVGDELVITPTLPPRAGGAFRAPDTARIRHISGRTVTLSRRLAHAHPAAVGGGRTLTAEILNLSRNVRIEGTAKGRSHIFIRASVPQAISHVAIRHMGPRKWNPAAGQNEFVLGRYGLHFHEMMNRSRGTLVNGVVIRDGGSHAFVPHHSNGITMRQCISHLTKEDAFWWDDKARTNHITWDRCVASAMRIGQDKYGIGSFKLAAGTGNVVAGCVAAGGDGGVTASGFFWPAGSIAGDWAASDLVSHNNATLGIYVWENTSRVRNLIRLTCYRNGSYGAQHGSYNNRYLWRDCTFFGNGDGAVLLSAVSKGPTGRHLRFENCFFDASGRPFAVSTDPHRLDPGAPTRFNACTFRGARRAGLGLMPDNHTSADWIDLVRCTFHGNEFWLNGGITPNSRVRVQDTRHGSIKVLRADRPGGTFVGRWNAKKLNIPKFA